MVRTPQALLLGDLCLQVSGDDVEKHASNHLGRVLELSAISVEHGKPTIHMPGQVCESVASSILFECLCAGILNCTTGTFELYVQTSPHHESVAFLLGPACQLDPPVCQGERKIVNQCRLELHGEVFSRLIVWADCLGHQEVQCHISIIGGNLFKEVPPMDLHF